MNDFKPKDGKIYRRLAAAINHGVIVEVGFHHGVALSYIVETCRANHNRLVSVDMQRHAELEKYADLEIMTMPSVEAAKHFANRSVDLVFLDATRDYKSVQADIAAWLPKVKIGGILAGYDQTQAEGVIRGILAAYETEGTIWIYRAGNSQKPYTWYYGNRDGIDGWFSPEDGQEYHRLVQGVKDGLVIEVGSYHGLSLSYIVDLCRHNNNRIVSIDYACYPELLANIDRWGAQSFMDVVTQSSPQAAARFEDNSADVVFIDASHDYESVKKDIIGWLPKVKPGGIIAGHDYCSQWPTVIQACDELLHGLTVGAGSCVWHYRKPK